MSNPLVLPLLWMTDDGDVIENSLRFRAANSARMTRTFTSVGNRKTWTYSIWVKRGLLGSTERVLFNTNSGNDQLEFSSSDTLTVQFGGATALNTSAVYRDVSAWYHVVLAVDTTQATAANRVRLYVNGSEVTAFSTASYPSLNADLAFNNNTQHEIGWNTGASYYDGLIARPEFVGGSQLTPSSFGQTDAATNMWVPKVYAGSYGTNGFRLTFADTTSTTTLGYDTSGNGNDWTLTNFSTSAGVDYDPSLDVPTNTYAVWNGAENLNVVSLSRANMRATGSGAAARTIRGTSSLGAATPIYFELTMTTYFNVNYPMLGMSDMLRGMTTGTIATGSGGRFICCYPGAGSGWVANDNGSSVASGASTQFTTSGDIVMFAWDPTTGKFWVGKNGTWYNSGDPAAGTNPTGTISAFIGAHMTPAVTTYDSSVVDLNVGQRAFAYTPPTGFKALCTDNISTPSIKKPSVQFNPVLYTGTGASLSVTGVGFQPDLVWIKSRSAATDHAHYDAVRGVQNQLESNNTGAETTETTGLTAFGSDGFTVGALAQVNTNTATYVAWNWKEGATPGFDIVTYTGNGANRTISHALGAVPHLIIVKGRSGAIGGAQNWRVYHRNANASPQSGGLYLSLTNGFTTDSTWWNNTAPTSSVFSVGTDTGVNSGDGTYVAYLWTEIADFSRIGSYVGNSSSDGPFVWCGFRPAFILIKSTAGGSQWMIYDDKRDGYNVDNDHLNPDDNATEGTDDDIDFLSNGFKLRRSSPNFNNSGDTFVFAAFAEFPFKYSNAR